MAQEFAIQAIRKLAWVSLFGLLGCNSSDQDDSVDKRPWFANEAASRGIDFTHVSGQANDYFLPEIMGGGAALVDVDGDDDLDVYLIQSGSLRERNQSGGNALYLNDGAGHFTHVNGSGLEDTRFGMGVATGDFNNDGKFDIFVSNVGTDGLFENVGDGRFQEIGASAGIDANKFSTSAAFVDLDNDGFLDLFVTNYVDWRPGIERPCFDRSSGVRNYCDPMNYARPTVDTLYRNNGDGTFSNVTRNAGIDTAYGNGLGVAVADFNEDGWQDIYIANDQTPNHLWINQGDFTFIESATDWGCAMDDHGVAKAGMGVIAADLESDGDFDVVVVNIEGETDSYYRNEGTYFVDGSSAIGLATITRGFTRFGIALADFNLDGFLDLFVANGRVAHTPESAVDDVFAEPNVLLQGHASRRFRPNSNAFETPDALVHTSRAAAVGDVDGDGRLDLLVGNRDAAPYLLINRTSRTRNWIAFRLLNRMQTDDIGAIATIQIGERSIRRSVTTSGSYLAASSPFVHFGLGDNNEIGRITVNWTSGTSESFGPFSVNQIVTINESIN